MLLDQSFNVDFVCKDNAKNRLSVSKKDVFFWKSARKPPKRRAELKKSLPLHLNKGLRADDRNRFNTIEKA